VGIFSSFWPLRETKRVFKGIGCMRLMQNDLLTLHNVSTESFFFFFGPSSSVIRAHWLSHFYLNLSHFAWLEDSLPMQSCIAFVGRHSMRCSRKHAQGQNAQTFAVFIVLPVPGVKYSTAASQN